MNDKSYTYRFDNRYFILRERDKREERRGDTGEKQVGET
jgi:hypothetical protein